MQAKICSDPDCEKSGEPQPMDNFHWRNKASNTRYGKCIPCYYRSQKAWRIRNRRVRKTVNDFLLAPVRKAA